MFEEDSAGRARSHKWEAGGGQRTGGGGQKEEEGKGMERGKRTGRADAAAGGEREKDSP